MIQLLLIIYLSGVWDPHKTDHAPPLSEKHIVQIHGISDELGYYNMLPKIMNQADDAAMYHPPFAVCSDCGEGQETADTYKACRPFPAP